MSDHNYHGPYTIHVIIKFKKNCRKFNFISLQLYEIINSKYLFNIFSCIFYSNIIFSRSKTHEFCWKLFSDSDFRTQGSLFLLTQKSKKIAHSLYSIFLTLMHTAFWNKLLLSLLWKVFPWLLPLLRITWTDFISFT